MSQNSGESRATQQSESTTNPFVTMVGLFVAALLFAGYLTTTPASASAATMQLFKSVVTLDVKGLEKLAGLDGSAAAKRLAAKGLIRTPSGKNFGYVAVPASWTTGLPSLCERRANQYMDMLVAAAKSRNIDVRLGAAQGCAESNLDPNTPCSGKQACGPMQIIAGTAVGLGVTNRFDPRQSYYGGFLLVRKNLNHYKNLDFALAAYNAGGGAVDGYEHGVKVRGVGVPPYHETIDYVDKIKRWYRACGGTT